MSYSTSAPARGRRTRPTVLVVLGSAGAALVGFLVASSLAPSSSAAPPIAVESLAADDVQAVANLDPRLLEALRAAAADAADDGTTLYVNSGWRSPEHQRELLREAVSKYGSHAEAARWVATPETSPHVSGDAVDVGPSDARSWLSEHGAAYGLCQIYRNEPWHYELRPAAVDHSCPDTYADPTEDPRMGP
ncbi:M15 family metallopeptidase [Mumia sp. Pv 4-285]|uniref:M15 family metallopeptidase n=1 Tax=Mumia qirimensis TaxID=3234852 RepID=UPI00351D5F3D